MTAASCDSGPQPHEGIMDPMEAQAKATIAAALIVRGAVEIPAMPTKQRSSEAAGARLRELTNYVYELVTTDAPLKPE
jgi:hypothetical protein